MITDEAKQGYLKKGGNSCPFCKSALIDSGLVHLENDTFVAYVSCGDCEKVWKDIYGLVDVEEVSDEV